MNRKLWNMVNQGKNIFLYFVDVSLYKCWVYEIVILKGIANANPCIECKEERFHVKRMCYLWEKAHGWK